MDFIRKRRVTIFSQRKSKNLSSHLKFPRVRTVHRENKIKRSRKAMQIFIAVVAEMIQGEKKKKKKREKEREKDGNRKLKAERNFYTGLESGGKFPTFRLVGVFVIRRGGSDEYAEFLPDTPSAIHCPFWRWINAWMCDLVRHTPRALIHRGGSWRTNWKRFMEAFVDDRVMSFHAISTLHRSQCTDGW